MEEPTSSSRINRKSCRERYAQFMEESWCAQYFLGPNPFMSRYVYALIFLVTNLLAWTIRDYGRSALSELQSMHLSFLFLVISSVIQPMYLMCNTHLFSFLKQYGIRWNGKMQG
jgi:hypothetical protein